MAADIFLLVNFSRAKRVSSVTFSISSSSGLANSGSVGRVSLATMACREECTTCTYCIQVNQKFLKRENIGIANMHKKYRRQDRDPGYTCCDTSRLAVYAQLVHYTHVLQRRCMYTGTHNFKHSCLMVWSTCIYMTCLVFPLSHSGQCIILDLAGRIQLQRNHCRRSLGKTSRDVNISEYTRFISGGPL